MWATWGHYNIQALMNTACWMGEVIEQIKYALIPAHSNLIGWNPLKDKRRNNGSKFEH